tara:strand:+ start:139 stop:531 length:393 start_codon:yes stop_codon:yes gene_type:complete
MAKKYGIQLRGLGRALKPKGPGVLRPKPTDRYGQQMKPKPIRPGKKDGGKVKKFPDLTGDGKVTRADVLKGRGVFKKGGSSNYHTTKDGRRVKKGLYYYMNRAKKLGKSKPGKGSVSDKALKRSAKTAKK